MKKKKDQGAWTRSPVLSVCLRPPQKIFAPAATADDITWLHPSHFLKQRFSIPVLAPRSEYFAYLSLLTHLIQIISSLEVRSVHELCSDWHAPYTVSIAPCSLSRVNPLKFTSEHSFMDLRCATSSRTDKSNIIHLCKYIQFKFSSRTLQCSFNGIYAFASNWNIGGISCDVHFAGHLQCSA